MEDSQIKQIRKTLLHQMETAEEKLVNASLLLDGKMKEDAVPILFKCVDISLKTLLALKQQPMTDFQNNIKTLEIEYKREGFLSQETIKSFQVLFDMNQRYQKEMEVECEEKDIKYLFENIEKFVNKANKFLKSQLTTSKERIINRRIRKILAISGVLIAIFLIIFFLARLALNVLGPERGLLAHYYNNINLKGQPAVEKIDKKINFVWGERGPLPRIKDNFSVRWEGSLKIDKDDIYTFYIKSDEGTRLFIDNKLIINTWKEKKRPMTSSGKIRLNKGFHHIKLEYYFNQKFADIKLLWSSRAFKKRPVSSKFLFPPSGQKNSGN